VSQHDPIGFVDFCVADLEPNGTGLRGWYLGGFLGNFWPGISRIHLRFWGYFFGIHLISLDFTAMKMGILQVDQLI
jgi:hypothetical protein